jgi:hypothetical protein
MKEKSIIFIRSGLVYNVVLAAFLTKRKNMKGQN